MGKGSKRRPRIVDPVTEEKNWHETFHKDRPVPHKCELCKTTGRAADVIEGAVDADRC